MKYYITDHPNTNYISYGNRIFFNLNFNFVKMEMQKSLPKESDNISYIDPREIPMTEF